VSKQICHLSSPLAIVGAIIGAFPTIALSVAITTVLRAGVFLDFGKSKTGKV